MFTSVHMESDSLLLRRPLLPDLQKLQKSKSRNIYSLKKIIITRFQQEQRYLELCDIAGSQLTEVSWLFKRNKKKQFIHIKKKIEQINESKRQKKALTFAALQFVLDSQVFLVSLLLASF